MAKVVIMMTGKIVFRNADRGDLCISNEKMYLEKLKVWVLMDHDIGLGFSKVPAWHVYEAVISAGSRVSGTNTSLSVVSKPSTSTVTCGVSNG
jgi:hypothetical protein